jgi:hypothetical protein
MYKLLNIIAIVSLSLCHTSFGQKVVRTPTVDAKRCKVQIDSFTKTLTYITADVMPMNEGGKGALMRKLERVISFPTVVPNNFEPNITVAFIVDIDGNIKGERIVRDKTSNVGQQMLDVVKTFKWTPASCKGKKIAMLTTLTTIADPSEN